MRAIVALAMMAGLVSVAAPARAEAPPSRLTNLAHLDFLGDRVAPPAQAGHTTYRLAQHPQVGVLWTYADKRPTGFERVGGGPYDATTNTYAQGAFNADDLARAAVVYLRDWRQTGHAASRTRAKEMLRGLTYLQTTTGRNAGNVVLWMQPDGTLNRSAEPAELPDPSDSDASYWLARSVWALGEGYAAFQRTDPGFARFLAQRLDLAVGAIDRQVLDAYGTYESVDGRRTPAWLIADGADASAEAVLGLASYLRAGGTAAARRALTELSNGIAAMAGGDARRWPFGGVLPWALSRSDWHAWSSQMSGALARAADVTGHRAWRRVAQREAFTFDPWMLTSGGPDNGRLPARVDATQIAYGADSRTQNLLAVGGGARQLAGMAAAWFFGANASGAPTYDPTTGVTLDGVAADGTSNQNSGAESTIHGLLTMLALDAHPAVRRIAMASAVKQVVGTSYVQAEDGRIGPGATAVTPMPTWTGESQYAGTGYVSQRDGGATTIDLGPQPEALVLPVLDLQQGSSAVTRFTAGGRLLGSVRSGDVGAQGASPAPGALLPVTLGATLPGSVRSLTATTTARGRDTARLDAVMVQPLLSRLVLGSDGHGTALLRSSATVAARATVAVPGTGRADIRSYDGRGHLLRHTTSTAHVVPVRVAPGGVTLVRR
ncbi:MAG: hypothetical protein JWR90_2488 [Marmoricola sp.]|nr:hypothetical protein [Marmoricola sp.]